MQIHGTPYTFGAVMAIVVLLVGILVAAGLVPTSAVVVGGLFAALAVARLC